MATIYTFRSPIIHKMTVHLKAQLEYIVNLLPLNATPVVAAPFTEYDWPLIARAKPFIDSETYSWSYSLYQPNPSTSFHYDLWENPASPKAYAIGESYGILNPVLTPNPARPFKQDEWHGAALTRWKATGEVFSLLDVLLTQDVPFHLNDWLTVATPKKVAKVDLIELLLQFFSQIQQFLFLIRLKLGHSQSS